MTDIHSCSYHCDKPECIKAQRDALRERLAQPEQEQWDAIPDAFNEWWDADYDDTGNPFRKDSPAYWAWSGWKAASKQPEQEPVAWLDGPHLVVRLDMRNRLNYQGPWVDLGRAIPDKWTPFLYTAPPQATWVGLTDDEIDYLYVEHRGDGGPTAICEQFARAVLAKAKEKNT